MSHKRRYESSSESEDELPVYRPIVEPISPVKREIQLTSEMSVTLISGPIIPGSPPKKVVKITKEDSEKVPKGGPNRFISNETITKMKESINLRGRTCKLCRFYIPNERRLRTHCAQHYSGMFCECGFGGITRRAVTHHQKNRKDCKAIYQVDKENLVRFVQEVRPSNRPLLVPIRPLQEGVPKLKSCIAKVSKVEVRPIEQPPNHLTSKAKLAKATAKIRRLQAEVKELRTSRR